MDYAGLGRRIRAERTRHGWTQGGLAEVCNVSTSFIGHVERGTRKASMETVLCISDQLGVSMDYLVKGVVPEIQLLNRDGRAAVGDQPQSTMRKVLATLYEHRSEWAEK